MRNIPIQLIDHYQGAALTIANLWKITRTDGAVFGFTDIDEDITYLGTTYLAGTGITPSAVDTASSFGVDNLNVDSVLTSETISERDLKIGLWDGARVDLWQVNFNNLADGHAVIRTGYLGEVQAGRINFSAELRGLSQRLQTNVGRIYSPACDANLGDGRCRFDLAPLTVTGTIATVESNHAFTSADLAAFVDGYFQNGVVTFTSGDNNGFKVEVISFAQATKRVGLYLPARFPLLAGDTFSIVPGCDKKLSTCKAKFNNLANFRGFPTVPGPDMLTSGKGPATDDTEGT